MTTTASHNAKAAPMATPYDGPDNHPEFDTSKPTIARVYDALLGGKDNFAADREGAATYLKYVPDAGRCAIDNRDALVKGVRYLVRRAGIDQFLDIGSGLPTVKNTHQTAQEINPEARVVYVDNDPIVLAHGRALLATNNTTTVITADMRDPGVILADPDLGRLIDFSRPVAVLFVAVFHFIRDSEDPAGILA